MIGNTLMDHNISKAIIAGEENSRNERINREMVGDYEKPGKKTALGVQVGGNHYKILGIQPWEYIEKNKLDFFQGSVVKYVTRFRDKNGIEDLKKAIHVLEFMIEEEFKLQNEQKENNA